MAPLSDVLPTLIRDDRNLLKVFAWAAFGEIFCNGNLVTYLPLLVLPLAMQTRFVEWRGIVRPTLILLVLLK